jgi:formylmethanofuran dehydrogenase subunit C
MNETRLRLKQQPALCVDLRGVLPAQVAALAAAELGALQLWHGNERIALGDLFAIERRDAAPEPVLRFEGDLSRCDWLGAQMDGGALFAETCGDYVGLQMRSGRIEIAGRVGVYAACEMSGGTLQVGATGDFAAAALPGSMDGMRGGTLIVRGAAGARFGDRMRRGTAIVFGDAGDFLASRMVAGTIAVAGRCGKHPGFGMRRGSLVLLQPLEVPPTFAATDYNFDVAWTLLARSLQRHGGAFTNLGKRRPRRLAGDRAVDGRGEILLSRA